MGLDLGFCKSIKTILKKGKCLAKHFWYYSSTKKISKRRQQRPHCINALPWLFNVWVNANPHRVLACQLLETFD